MKSIRYIQRNLSHHRKSLISTLAGITVSAAVLTGAFTIGDSVKYSLKSIAGARLGNATYAVSASDGLFRSSLADSLQKQLGYNTSPILLTRGVAVNNQNSSRINNVEVIGIRDDFPSFWNDSLLDLLPGEAIISHNVAKKLSLKTGDDFLVRVIRKSNTPKNAPFVADDKPSLSRRLKLKAIAPDQSFGRFNLQSNQSPPYNIFVRLDELNEMQDIDPSANLLLLHAPAKGIHTSDVIESAFRNSWSLEDAGLHIRSLPNNGRFELVSERIFIGQKTYQAFESIHPQTSPHLTYLVNEITNKLASTPYSFVTALTTLPGAATLKSGEIILNNWLATDLNASVGDTLHLSYFVMGTMRSLQAEKHKFLVTGIIPVKDDHWFMPEFPGMNEAGSCREWETGAPIDLKKIREKDEVYWNQFRGTPKAYIALEDGIHIWSNPFGDYTGVRFDADSVEVFNLHQKLPGLLSPSEHGISFLPVGELGKHAAENATDFGELFLGLGFFIILSGTLLTALLSGLYFSNRAKETGILSAIGFSKKRILKLFMAEALIISITGSLFGSLSGIIYNNLMIKGLNTIWQGAVGTVMLTPYLEFASILTGFLIAFFISFTTMLIVLWYLLKQQPSDAFQAPPKVKAGLLVKILAYLLIAGGGIITLLSLAKIVSGPAFALTAGGLLLSGLQLLVLALMHGKNYPESRLMNLKLLVQRNMLRKLKRSVAVIALISLGTFSLLITAINHRNSDPSNRERSSGTGGFLFWAETSIPLRLDLSSVEGKTKAGLHDEEELQGLEYLQCYRLHRDDASCLNLNQVSNPGIIGIEPGLFDTLGAFDFQSTEYFVDPAHPWLALNKQNEKKIIYAFADQTVITWGIRMKTGDTLLYISENGEPIQVVLAGGLKNSIFQGNLLIAADQLKKYFPSTASPDLVLIDGNTTNPEVASSRLEFLLSDYGFSILPAVAKLDSFLIVQNTYLSVFLILGGFGMILGILGLGILLLRNLQDRRAEIALYTSIGIPSKTVLRILLSEYGLLLPAGMLIGILAAIPLLLPAFQLHQEDIPWSLLLIMLFLILVNGLAWIYFPALKFLKQNLIIYLRNE